MDCTIIVKAYKGIFIMIRQIITWQYVIVIIDIIWLLNQFGFTKHQSIRIAGKYFYD
jgi:hypothetical protein